ncbi:MAG: hypothetical protein Tsb0015_01870 [Simkaniaceae bacterium]
MYRQKYMCILIPRYKKERKFEGKVFKDSQWRKNYAPYDRSFVLEESMLFKIRDALKSFL